MRTGLGSPSPSPSPSPLTSHLSPLTSHLSPLTLALALTHTHTLTSRPHPRPHPHPHPRPHPHTHPHPQPDSMELCGSRVQGPGPRNRVQGPGIGGLQGGSPHPSLEEDVGCCTRVTPNPPPSPGSQTFGGTSQGLRRAPRKVQGTAPRMVLSTNAGPPTLQPAPRSLPRCEPCSPRGSCMHVRCVHTPA